MTFPASPRRVLRFGLATLVLGTLAACSSGLDFDMRGNVGDNFSTSRAAQGAVGGRPAADARGVISYPTYQVAVAQRGDTVADVAMRVGLPADELARYNGVLATDALRTGEIIALPRRVAEPDPATLVVPAPGQIDITELAGNAIDGSAATPAIAETGASGLAQTGVEPVRHRVARGETVYTIARLYNVSVRSLADWNALDSTLSLREGQYLLIPVVLSAPAPRAAAPVTTEVATVAPSPAVPLPGIGSPTPQPPSASTPLPAETPPAAATPVETPPAPRLETSPAPQRNAQMGFPVEGSIIREYSRGRNDGIDISASSGAPVKAAASGIVAAITSDADNIPIIIVKHPDNLLTVYANVGNISVNKDDRVSRGQTLGQVRPGSPPYLHFEVRRGFDSVDPMPFLQ